MEVLVLLITLAINAFFIWCAYKTAVNGRWGLFVLGFFCGIAWLVGAFSAGGGNSRRQQKKDYERMKQRQTGVIAAPAAVRADGRCPSCGKAGPHDGPRCSTCGHFFGT